MDIHIVESGDTLNSIASIYNVSLDKLIEINGITDPDKLVVGQSILVPINGQYYKVSQGDTLSSIGQEFALTIDELIKANALKTASIGPNDILWIPDTNKPLIESGAYVYVGNLSEAPSILVGEVANNLTYVNIFDYEVLEDGSLSYINDDAVIDAALSENANPIMVITNIKDGSFNTELANTILSNQEVQETLIDNVINIVNEKGYTGVNVDFEYLGIENKDKYIDFLRNLKQRLNETNPYLTLGVAVPPKTSSDQAGILYEGHDYKSIGEIADRVYIMTYEWGYSYGPPMAVAPLDKVKDVMTYAISEIPKDKIIMGIPLYGYDWTLPYEDNKPAKSLNQVEAIELASNYGSEIKYDDVSESPYFNYNDGENHIVWFEDARSYRAKMELVKELGIEGLFFWVLGFDAPQAFTLLNNEFFIL